MQIAIYREKSAFEKLAKEWKMLLASSSADSPFLTPAFQRVWWEAFGQDGALHLVAVRDDEGRLVGLAPFYRLEEGGKGLLRLVGGVEVADYLDIIARQGQTEAVWLALLEHLLEPETPSWSLLDLHNVRANSPSRKYLPVLAPKLGLSFAEEVEEICPAIELPATWEEYLAVLSKKDRHEVRRKLRRAEREAQVRYSVVLGEEGLERAIEDFIALHRASAREKGSFMDERMQRFFHCLAQEASREGWLRLEFLEANGERVAALFDFDYGGDVLVYNSGFHPERYGHLSTGIVLLAYSIREAIAQRKRCYDFLRGDEDYKYRLGGKDRLIYHLTIERKD